MIDIRKAILKVVNSSIQMDVIELELLDALNYYLAKDVVSPMKLPPFSQSAMDGYAICGDFNKFDVVGEVKAGDTEVFELKEGQAYRIFTGAMVPENTTAIAKQEIAVRIDDVITLTETVKEGTSIRKAGEELNKSDLVLTKGTKLNAAAIGLLSSLGISSIPVCKKPKVTVIVTGSELTKIGDELIKGKIYESNSYTIKSVLLDNGFESEVQWVKDDYSSTLAIINTAINSSDLVIMTGGISVGDYDFVGKALQELQVKEIFYKVNQKPGKPIFYGEKNKTKIFALPGNPAAALTCFYVYVLTALKSMMGSSNPELIETTATIQHHHLKKGDRAHLLKAKINNNKVEVHRGQSSAMLSSYVDANCLIHLESDVKEVKKDDIVNVMLLP